MEITLIRHTRVAIPPGIVYGATDVNVASTFEEEAQIVASHIRDKNSMLYSVVHLHAAGN